VKNYHYNTEQKTLQHSGRRNLEEYVFDAFMPVFCVLTMEIMEGVVSYVTDKGVRVHEASHEELVCELKHYFNTRIWNI
jgi:hypothetical protein